MKKEVPTWALLVSAVIALALIGWFVWGRTSAAYGEKIVDAPYDPSKPGNGMGAGTGAGAGAAAPAPGTNAAESSSKM